MQKPVNRSVLVMISFILFSLFIKNRELIWLFNMDFAHKEKWNYDQL